ncbi:MAG: hypothetical protein M3R16_09630 [Pseudomonadota bacterium]|nr:hypothetical protein [Pseudomonadota bacterium]
MSAHTPGPWILAPDERHCEIEITATSRKGRVCIGKVETGFSEPFESEQWANARLIAAAPDLLEALNGLLGAASLGAATGKPFAIDSPGIVAARAAIAKANGAAP